MTANTASKPGKQDKQKPEPASKTSKLKLLSDDESPHLDEYVATREALRVVAAILEGDEDKGLVAKFEEIWLPLSETQRAEAAIFLAFACVSLVRHLGENAYAPLRNIGAYWLLPDELYRNSDDDIKLNAWSGSEPPTRLKG